MIDFGVGMRVILPRLRRLAHSQWLIVARMTRLFVGLVHLIVAGGKDHGQDDGEHAGDVDDQRVTYRDRSGSRRWGHSSGVGDRRVRGGVGENETAYHTTAPKNPNAAVLTAIKLPPLPESHEVTERDSWANSDPSQRR